MAQGKGKLNLFPLPLSELRIALENYLAYRQLHTSTLYVAYFLSLTRQTATVLSIFRLGKRCRKEKVKSHSPAL